MADEPEQTPPTEPEPFPRFVTCSRCRREYTVNECKAKASTTYEFMTFTCPRCTKPLKKVPYREWYERLVKGVPAPALEKDPKNY